MTRSIFNLNDEVRVIDGPEVGVVVGRSQVIDGANGYLVRMRTGNRRQERVWFNEIDLVASTPTVTVETAD